MQIQDFLDPFLAVKMAEKLHYYSASTEDVNLSPLLDLFQKLSLPSPLLFSVQL